MLLGFTSTALYLVLVYIYGIPLLTVDGVTSQGVDKFAAATIGMPLGFVTILLLSVLTRRPPQKQIDQIDALRRRGDDIIYVDKN